MIEDEGSQSAFGQLWTIIALTGNLSSCNVISTLKSFVVSSAQMAINSTTPPPPPSPAQFSVSLVYHLWSGRDESQDIQRMGHKSKVNGDDKEWTERVSGPVNQGNKS